MGFWHGMRHKEKTLYIVELTEIKVQETVLGRMISDRKNHRFFYSNLGISVKNLNILLKKYSKDAHLNDKTARNYIAERNKIVRKYTINDTVSIEAKITKHFMNRDIEKKSP